VQDRPAGWIGCGDVGAGCVKIRFSLRPACPGIAGLARLPVMQYEMIASLFERAQTGCPTTHFPSLERLCRNWQNHAFAIFVIPGLTRNPVLFQTITLLDAGSSPA
jgi:hypothetical protein